MASTPEATRVTPEMEARFRAIADVEPPLEDDQIKERLSRNPSIDPKIYFRWVIPYLADKAYRTFAGPPVSVSSISDLLKRTHYDDPQSMFDLVTGLNPPNGNAPVPLGNYTPSGHSQTFCFLQSRLGTLPVDFPPDPKRGEALVTQIKCSPPVQGIPEFVLQIGQLVVSSSATSTDSDMNLTEFIVGVATDRKVFAFWNPLGDDPDDIYMDEDDSPSEEGVEPALPRPTAGTLPGLTETCAVARFNATIDDLLTGNRIQQTLPFSGSNLISLPSNGTIQFGGVDSDGWKRLDQVSKQFAAVPTIDNGTPAAGG